MHVKQLSVFVENAPGKLAELTRFLGENHIDMDSICVADTTNFGIVRMIVEDWERAAQLIQKQGYTVRVTDVLAVIIPNEPGSLAVMLEKLAADAISVEYLYSMIQIAEAKAVGIVLRVDDLEKAEAALKNESGIRLLTQEDIRSRR